MVFILGESIDSLSFLFNRSQTTLLAINLIVQASFQKVWSPNKRVDFIRFGAFLGLLLLTVLSSCQTSEEGKDEPNVYYDLKEFVEGQIETMSQEKPTITKKMIVGDKEEVRSTTTVDWKKELELFIQADLNKNAYKLSYATNRPDSLTYEYVLKTEEDLPVRRLKIVLDEATQKPALVEALILSENKLYESERNLQLRCGLRNGAWRVTSYHIQGFQELAIGDRKPFDVKVEIPN
jgi:hypothetical protein